MGASLSGVGVCAIVGALLLAGCAGIERASQPELRPDAAPAGATASVAPPVAPPVEPPVAPVAPAAGPPSAVVAEQAVVVPEPIVKPQVPAAAGIAAPVSASPEVSAARTPAKVPAAPPPAAQPPKKDPPAPALAKPEAPPLDLKSLETRLRETKAIGVFTKLAVKNQVDELLERFRAFYQGKLKTSLSELRRSYDMLVLKVLALLQDADPPLASAIAASRESIWAILSNPAKFAAV
jgi:hypothetical protein